ncbi:GC-rich sequence DNA-binding factor-like protein-domain-containing protein [Paraphysoderma sedebokerense]|nr:GC-rich sequence DNA-binding factor-like protein-domain-containing protein [Paraphysoderma sedebokerense]
MTFASTKDKRKLNDTSVSSKSEPPSKSFSELKQNFKVDKEFAKFEKHTKGIGLKLLMKMGYKPGQGLGSEGAGIVKPIEVMQRPKGMGLAYKDFKEKTKQAKEEELRRKEQEGTIDETEMDELDKISGKGKTVPRPKTGGWKKSAAKKKKVQYKTAIEVMADVSNAPEAPAQSMKIIDMTGPEARVLSSANQVKSSEQLFYDTSARLPELRHNLRLLVGMAQADLEQTARQQRLDTARLQELNQTVGSLQRNVQNEEAALKRLSEVSQLTKDFQRKMKIMGGSMDFDDLANDASIDEFFTKLITSYYDEYRKHKLDALVVAVIAPLVKRLFADWNALEEPERGLTFFEKWRKLLSSALPRSAMESIDPVTTPYESLIYHIWLPKIRSAINSSDFNIRNPSSAIHLLDIWYPTHLPPFVYVNIIDQLILPKITDAVNSWNPRKDPTPIHTWIHPWLPHLDNRLTTLYPSIRHKIGILLDSWHPSQTNMIDIISPWSTIFSSSDFNILLSKSIIPKLQVTLHSELSINPAHQILDPLNWTIEWLPLLGIHQTSRLLETEFVPKWLNVLYLWLTSPNPNFDEITTWYMTWKQYFPPDLIDSTVSTGLARGFKMGLDLMNQALAGIKIQPPVFIPSTSSISEPSITPIPSAASQPQRPQHEPTITFKDLLTHLAESNGLMFMSTTKTHEKSGKYLWKLVNSENRGVLVYLEDEVAFIKNENGEWAPIGVDELIEQVLRM